MGQFLLFIFGVGLFLIGITSGTDSEMRLLSLGLGLALMIGQAVSIAKRSELRKNLLAGTDAIARWELTINDLLAFQAVDRHRTADGRDFGNRLGIRNTVPGAGIAIVIGKRGWLIGDRLYRHGARDFGVPANIFMFDGDPGYIEVAVLGTIDGQQTRLVLLRLPVPVAARTTARTAAAHLAADIRASDRAFLWDEFPEYAGGVEPGGKPRTD